MPEPQEDVASCLAVVLGFVWVVILPAIGLLWCLGWIQ